jgi:integration host factor subunit alpha
MTLTKAIIAEAISKKMSHKNIESLEMIDSLLEIIKQKLESGEHVLISGFGKFSVKEKMERQCRNPQNGQPMMLAPRKVLTFKCSGKLRDRTNGKK